MVHALYGPVGQLSVVGETCVHTIESAMMMMMMITYTASVGLAIIIKKQLYKLVNKLLTLI